MARTFPLKTTHLNNIVLVLTAFLFLWGGLGLYLHEARIAGAVVSGVFLLALLLSGRKIVIPKGFVLFFIFLLLLGVNTLWSQGKLATLEYLITFTGGGALWLVFYQLADKFKESFPRLILILGVIFGASLIINLVSLPQVPIRAWTLYLPATLTRNHNHLGDLWAIVLVLLVYWQLIRPRWWYWVLAAAGVYFLGVSLSRSAYLALAIGSIFIFYKLKQRKIPPKYFIGLVVLVTGLFLYAAAFKTTLLSRPYFEQVIYGITKWPLGVGVGNFGTISLNPQSPWWSGPRPGIVSSAAHNIVLEMVAGQGVLSFIFVGWLVYVLIDILRKSKQVLFSAVFLAITANFMFDTTYYIPTMLWLWFASLGVAQARHKHNEIAKNAI
jgi:hypothetical protein